MYWRIALDCICRFRPESGPSRGYALLFSTAYSEETYRFSGIYDLARIIEDRRWMPTVNGSETQRRILIADDNELIRRQIRRILERDQQVQVCAEAENGAEAVRKADQYRPDVVLMDVFMPVLSGLAAAREIKKTSPHLPVVIFTLYDSADIQEQSRKAGADAFVAKADAAVELLPTIHRLLR